MNFQLFKTADMSIKVAAPRIEDLVTTLRYVVAPSYIANEPEHPELQMLADALADHFMRMPEETKLFSSFRSKNPLDVVNRDIVRFKSSEIRAITESITESSVELSDGNVRALISIVMQAALYSAWISFTSGNLQALLFGEAEGLAFDELVKVAAEEDDFPAGSDDLQRGGRGRGRNRVRYSNLNVDPENASASQGLAEAARLAYNCAFHALTTSAGMPLVDFHRPGRAGERSQSQILRENALGMMVHRMDYCDFLSQCIQNHGDTLASGQRPIVAGSPITPNPVYASLIGTVDHSRHRRTSDSDRASPSAAFVLTALGQSEDTRSALQSRDMQMRLSVFGKEAKGCKIYGVELSGKDAHNRAGSLFNRDPDALKSGYEQFLVKGLQQNLLAVKANGIYFSRYEEVIPSLAKPEVQARVRAAMARIISGMPAEAASFAALAQAAQALVNKEAPGLADLDQEMKVKVKVKGKGKGEDEGKVEVIDVSRGTAKNFAEFAAQMLLKLPLHMASEWAELDIREALSPIPDINAARNIQLGGRSVSLQDALPRLLNYPERKIRAEEAIYNLFDLTPQLSSIKNLFIVARRVIDGDPTAPDLKELLRTVYSRISHRVGVAVAEASKKVAAISDRAQGLQAAGDADGLAKFVAENQKKFDILEGIVNSSPAEMEKALFKEMLLSIGHATSVDEAKIGEAAIAFVAGKYDESVPVLAQALAESFPAGKYNSSSIVQVDSDYNSFAKYESKKLGEKYRMGPGAGKYDHFGNSGAPIPPAPGAALVSIMYECSEHFKVDQLEREHITTEYSNNKKAHEDYIIRNYSTNPDSNADPARIEDIEKKCEELLDASKKGPIKADNIINKLGLGVLLTPPKELLFAKDIDERGVVATKNKSEYEAQTTALNRAKKDMLSKVQDFFKTHSKSSIVELLKQTPKPSGGSFDEFYYDALMVAISRKVSTIFDSDFEETIINRYGRKEIGSAAESAETEKAGEEAPPGAEMLEEADAAPGAVVRSTDTEEASQFKKMEEAAAYSAIAGSRLMAQADTAMAKNYVSRWGKDISFARSGGLASHSLPGFIAEVLGKKDALSDESLSPEERKSIESHLRKLRLFESADAPLRPMSDKLSYKYVPMFAHMKHRVRLSLGNQLFYKKSNSSLSRLLQNNKESGDPTLPLDRKGAFGRLMQKAGINFIDPVRMARKLAEGDRIGDSFELAFSRMLTSMGDLMIDEDYNAWERAALEYVGKVYRRKLESRIDSLAVQISDRKFMKDLITKVPATVDFSAPAFSAEERARLASIGADIGKPKGSVSATAFFNATRSADFGRIMAKLGIAAARHEDVRKLVESIPEYRQAFEFEASTGAPVAEALETALTMLGGPALNKEMNKTYLRSTAPRSKYVLDKLLAMQAVLDSLETWKKEKEKNKKSALGATMTTMSMAQFVVRIKQSSDVLSAMETSLQETYGDDADPDFNSPSEMRSMTQDLVAAVDAVFDPAGDASEFAASMKSTNSDIVDVAEADEDGQHAEPLLSYAIGTALGSLIGQECADNAQVAMLMQAVIPAEVLAKTFAANDVAAVKAFASEFRLDHPRINEIIESATDVKLSRPETIASEKLREQLLSGGVTPGLRRSIRSTEVAPMYGALLSTAKSKIEEIARQLVSAEANAIALRKARVIATRSVADGGASSMLGAGRTIVSAKTVLDSIRADNKTMYKSFADNLDRKIAEWVSGFSSRFPRLEQVAAIAIRKGGYYADLSSSEIASVAEVSTLPEPLQKLVDVRVDIEKKKKFISDLRERISVASLAGTIDMVSWKLELYKIEEAAQKEIASSFSMSAAQIVTEQMEEASVAQDDDKSVENDEIRRRDAVLDKIKISIDRMRNRALKAERVPESTRADAVSAATMLFKTLIAGRKTAVNAYDSQKLEEINSAIGRASADLDSMDKVLIGTGSSSVVARLVAAIDDDSVIDVSVYGAKVEPKAKAKVEPKKPDMASFAKEIAMAKSVIDRALSKAGADKDAAKEASASNALAFVSMFDQESELVVNSAATIESASSVISDLLRDLDNGREISEDYLRGALEDIAQSGITSKRRLPDYIEIAREVISPEDLGEQEDVTVRESPLADTSPLFDVQEGRLSPPYAEPSEEEFFEISEGDFEEIPETSGTEIPEISDEEVEEVQPPLPAPEPAAQPAEPLMEVQPGTLTPAPAGPAPVSKEAAIILNRIVEEVDAANSTLAAAGVAGPVHESLTGIKSRLTAAMASGSISDDLNKLAEVLGQAIALTDEVSTGDPSAFATIAPPAMADLLEGVSHIIMPKKASSRPPAFIRNGDSWTVLM